MNTGWCGGWDVRYDGEWRQTCHTCMSQAEQMAKDYEPPKPDKDHWVYCWGDNGGRFDRNCPDCVKATEALALHWDSLARLGWSEQTPAYWGKDRSCCYALDDVERMLEEIPTSFTSSELKVIVGEAYDSGVIEGRRQGKKLQFFKDRVLLKRHGFSEEGVDGVLGKGIT